MRALPVLLLLVACERERDFAVSPSAVASAPLTADAIFASVCSRCHGADGFGGPATDAGPGPRNFHDRAFQAARTDEQLKSVIKAGKSNAMPAFGDSFCDEALDGLVARIRSFNPKEATP